MTPGCGMIEPAVSPSRTTSNPLAARKAASAAPNPRAPGVCPSVLDTRFTPWRSTTRPEASVSHLPTWPIGSAGSKSLCEPGDCPPVADAADAKEPATSTGSRAMIATTILLIRVLMVHSPTVRPRSHAVPDASHCTWSAPGPTASTRGDRRHRGHCDGEPVGLLGLARWGLGREGTGTGRPRTRTRTRVDVPPNAAGRRHHVVERRKDLLVAPGLETAVGVHPQPAGTETLHGPADQRLQPGGLRHPGRVHIVDARSRSALVGGVPQHVDDGHVGTRRLERQDIHVQLVERIDNVAQLGVAHVGVDLGAAGSGGGDQSEGPGCPGQVLRSLLAAKG